MTVQFIDNQADLQQLCQQLSLSDWFAVDTEFLREKTYFPQLCLIQIATDDIIACVDPLKIGDLKPFLDVIYAEGKTVVFHAARQDLELFYQIRNQLPTNIFDTQVAATVLGYGDQIGYGNLVKQCINVDLDKAHSRTDWSQRPLTPEQIDYAADDVRYLRDLYKQLKQRLVNNNRLHWLKQDFSQLSSVTTYQSAPEKMWKKIKGFGRLKGQQLAILQKLAAWRENQAIARNKPRRWILKDEVMLDMARFAPTSANKLLQIRGLEAREVERHGQAIIEQITAGKEVPKEQWPKICKPTPLSNQQDAVVDLLMALLRKQCDDQSITPSAVATRKDLESLVRGDEDVQLLQGWRHEIVGQTLADFLAGKMTLSADHQQIYLHEQ